MSHLRYGRRTFALEILMIAVAVAFLFPIYVLVSLALKGPQELATDPLGLPSAPTLDNFSDAWSSALIGPALVNSLIVTVCSLVALIVLGSLAATFVARRLDRFGSGLYVLFLLGIVLPFQLGVIPLYSVMNQAGLLGSYVGIVLFYSGMQLPFTVFLYTGFIRTLPREYTDAALVDGATQFQAFRRILFPLLRPITGTVVILNAVFVWNDFFTPLLFLSGSAYETVPVRIFQFVGQYVSNNGLVFAGLVLAALPILIVFLLLQRYVIKGFSSGLKG